MLVKAISQGEHVTESGLHTVEYYAPDVIGTVEQIGEGVEAHDFACGDLVVFGASAGQEAEYDGATYIALGVDEILAVFEEEES